MSSVVFNYPDVLRHCRKQIRTARMCPVVGAGISLDVGLPDWQRLVARLAGVDKPIASEADPIWGAECVKAARGLNSEREFRTILANELYGTQSSEWAIDPVSEWSAPKLVARVALECAISGKRRSTPVEWPFHVITYNFDCLLEEAIQSLGFATEAIVPTIGIGTPYVKYRWEPPQGRNPWPTTVRVFHPHGLIKRPSVDSAMGPTYLPGSDPDSPTDEPEPASLPLILSADDYDLRGGDTPLWHNAMQLSAFIHRPCLFYGWSFRDPAVRKLLRIASQVRQQHLPDEHILIRQKTQQGQVPTWQHELLNLEHFGFGYQLWTDWPEPTYKALERRRRSRKWSVGEKRKPGVEAYDEQKSFLGELLLNCEDRSSVRPTPLHGVDVLSDDANADST